MGAYIHTISATEFQTGLTATDRLEFLADIAQEWVEPDGEVLMPESYARLFERRVAQAARLAEVEPEAMMTQVIALATEHTADGSFAWHRTLHLIDADEADLEVAEERMPEAVHAAAALAS